MTKGVACVKFVVLFRKDEETKGLSNYIGARIGEERRLKDVPRLWLCLQFKVYVSWHLAIHYTPCADQHSHPSLLVQVVGIERCHWWT